MPRKKPSLGFYRLRPMTIRPEIKTEESACYDISCNFSGLKSLTSYSDDVQTTNVRKLIDSEAEYIVINRNERVLVPTGLILDIPKGYSVRIHPRSGLSVKKGLTLINSQGIIDSDYVNELFIPIVNKSPCRQIIQSGERIAQLELIQTLNYNIEELETPPKQKTNRSGGFGSTGN